MTFCPPPVQLAAAAPVRTVITVNVTSEQTPAAYEGFTGLTSIGFGGIVGERTIVSVDDHLEVEI